MGVLSQCYANDERKAQLLLVRELPNFGVSTVVQLAVQADNKIFIAHTACQSLFNNIWRGRMGPENGQIKVNHNIDLLNFETLYEFICTVY